MRHAAAALSNGSASRTRRPTSRARPRTRPPPTYRRTKRIHRRLAVSSGSNRAAATHRTRQASKPSLRIRSRAWRTTTV